MRKCKRIIWSVWRGSATAGGELLMACIASSGWESDSDCNVSIYAHVLFPLRFWERLLLRVADSESVTVAECCG